MPETSRRTSRPARPTRLAILGSTGSIGTSALDVVRRSPGRFEVVALAAGKNIDVLARQVEEFRPRLVSVIDDGLAQALKQVLKHRLPKSIMPEVVSGVAGVVAVAGMDEADCVLSAVVGAAGLVPTFAAIAAGKRIALANKETLVMAGELVMAEAARRGVEILPVDSEHSAVFQSLEGHRTEDVNRIILTASGGPFLEKPASELARVTVSEALNHPRWKMGPKVTIDSSTLMNKGLECIEAHWLFGMPMDRIEVCVHPQSIVHSMVEYRDGSVIAQLAIPDMRIPIAYALSYPERLPLGLPRLDLFEARQLTFMPPDLGKFPCLSLAFEAAAAGGVMPAVLNAANEAAVNAFLGGRIPYLGIPRVIERVLSECTLPAPETIAAVMSADAWGRERTEAAVLDIGRKGQSISKG